MKNIGICKSVISVRDDRKPKIKHTELLTPLMVSLPLKFGGHIQQVPYDRPTLWSRRERERTIRIPFLEVKVQKKKEERNRETKIERNHV